MRGSIRIPVRAAACALAFMSLGSAPAAAQERAQNTAPTMDVCTNRGGAHMPASRIRACSALIESASTPDDEKMAARLNRAMAHFAAGDYAEIEADARIAIGYNGFNTRAHGIAYMLLGVSLAGQGDHAQAIEAYNRAYGSLYIEEAEFYGHHEPLVDQLLVLRGEAYAALGDYARAVANFDRAPAQPFIYNSRCWWRAVANVELATARQNCDDALAGAADDLQRADYLDSRGLVNLREEKWAEAWADYDAAVRLNPDFAHALYGRGLAAIRAGRTTEGRADVARAIRLDTEIAATYARFGFRP